MNAHRASNPHSIAVLFLVILIAPMTQAHRTRGSQPIPSLTGETTTQAAAAPVFAPAVTYDSGGSYPQSIVAVDVNGDTTMDLIVSNGFHASYSFGSVGVLLGNGDGTFQPTVAYDSGGFGTAAAVVADVNGDGRPDLLAANTCATDFVAGNCYSHGSVAVLLGNGDGTFRAALTNDPGRSFTNSIAVDDVNRDGHVDVVAGNYGDSVAVLLGRGDGTFRLNTTYPSEGESSVALADVNGDLNPDLLVANQYNGIGVLLGNGDGTFQPSVVYESGGFYALRVTAREVSGDGRPDLLVANEFLSNEDLHTDGGIGVLLGNGDGTFQPAVAYDAGGRRANWIDAADLNADDMLDLVVANCASSGSNCGAANGVLGVLPGNRDGTFRAATTYLSGGRHAVSVTGADVNDDGRIDLLVANLCAIGSCARGAVGVLLNHETDTTAPLITLSVSPQVLWPPNNARVPVAISGTITDAGSGVNASAVAYAVTDEYGEVQPSGTITVSPGGNYSFTMFLQAFRRGTDLDGRRYTVTVRAIDNAGNAASKTSAVTVPHDRRN